MERFEDKVKDVLDRKESALQYIDEYANNISISINGLPTEVKENLTTCNISLCGREYTVYQIDELKDKINSSSDNYINEKLDAALFNQIFMNRMIDIFYDLCEAYSVKRCLKNIRHVIDKKGLKVGDIEREAGVRIGYLSRIEKNETASGPSIRFVATVAKMADTTVDYILFSNCGLYTEDETVLFRFFDRLLEDTYKKSLIWKRDKDASQRIASIANIKGMSRFLADITGNIPVQGIRVDRVRNAYKAFVSNLDGFIYISECKFSFSNSSNPSDYTYEVIIEEGNKLNRIYYFNVQNSSIDEIIKTILVTIERQNAEPGLDKRAIELMNKYLMS